MQVAQSTPIKTQSGADLGSIVNLVVNTVHGTHSNSSL